MSDNRKNHTYDLYKIKKGKKEALAKALTDAGLTVTDEKTVDGFTLTLYVLTDPTTPVWWAKTYHNYLKDQPKLENKVYCGVFLVSSHKLCYAVSMGKSYLYLKDFADPDFGKALAERITTTNNDLATLEMLGEGEKDETIGHTTTATVDDKWGTSITYGQSVRFHIPVTPNKLPEFILKIEKELEKPASQHNTQPPAIAGQDQAGSVIISETESITVTDTVSVEVIGDRV